VVVMFGQRGFFPCELRGTDPGGSSVVADPCEVAAMFLAAVVPQARRCGLLSAQFFSVDGTLIEAWAAMQELRVQGRR
jgi:hypothetical protein